LFLETFAVKLNFNKLSVGLAYQPTNRELIIVYNQITGLLQEYG